MDHRFIYIIFYFNIFGLIFYSLTWSNHLPKDTYFIADLLGLSVYTDEDILLGKVEDIYNSGANDIYVIKSEDGKQILLPGIGEVIKQIDLEQEKIIVHLIKGLV